MSSDFNIVFMVQYKTGTDWTNYQSYEDRDEAGRVADFLDTQGNATRVICWGEEKEEAE